MPGSLMPWSKAERNRLMTLRDQYSDLTWKQFHKLDLFPDRTNPAVQAMYARCKAERVEEMSDVESESEDRTGDDEEDDGVAEPGASQDLSKGTRPIIPRSAPGKRNSRALVGYGTSDSETDAKGTRGDGGLSEFDPPTPQPRKRKQRRVARNSSPRSKADDTPASWLWSQPPERSTATSITTPDTKSDLHLHPSTPARESRSSMQYPGTPDTFQSVGNPQLTLGEHLKQIQVQNTAMHEQLEEQIRALKVEANAAKERSHQAAALLIKLQQLGGMLNLSPSEVSALIDVIKATEFSGSGTFME